MILRCTFEELTALGGAAERARAAIFADGGSAVAAPPEVTADLDLLRQRLTGDIPVSTLAEQLRLSRALDFLLELAKDRMDALILEHYVGEEEAVIAYFEYAHVLSVSDRLDRLGDEMAALIELMTGEPPTPETARRTRFPH